MNDQEQQMARRFMGYGSWKAPYWFIGPEQGKGPGESEENLERVNAWTTLGSPELCDCREYHNLIGESNWHGDRPRLQRTWRPLILLLKTLLCESTSTAAIREYQSKQWGMHHSDTCVIELSGIAAKSLRTHVDRITFLEERIQLIQERIEQHTPRVVIMYGIHCRDEFSLIARNFLEADTHKKIGQTIYVLTPHPVSYGRKNDDWTKLGISLRSALERKKL